MTESFRLVQTTAPAVEPVALADAKNFLRIDHNDEDTLVTALITAARQQCEAYTGRALITQVFSLYLDNWPGVVTLPRPPLASVTQVLIYDGEDQSSVWDANHYFVDTAAAPGRIVLRTGGSAPTPTRAANGIEIQFTAGYGSAVSDVPQDLIEGIKRMIVHLYEHRGDAPDVVMRASGAQALWQSYRIMRLA